MFTTKNPITLISASETTSAVVAEKAYLCLSPFAPVITNGKLETTVLFRAYRCLTDGNGNVTQVGAPLDKVFPPAQLASLRSGDATINGLMTQLEDICDTLGPLLGL